MPAWDSIGDFYRSIYSANGNPPWMACSLPNDFYQHPFAPPAVELTVKNLLPRTEVELAVGDRDDHFAPHHLPLDVRVGVILARIVVSVLLDRLVRRELFQPDRIVMVQTGLV